MKLGNFPLVARAVAAREALLDQRNDGMFRIGIDGRDQDSDMIAAVAPAIRAELDRRIAELDEDLRGYGVEL